MIIGLDARPLVDKQPTGIGIYLRNIMSYINENDSENEYILYSNKPLNCGIDFNINFKTKVIPGKVGTIWLRYSVPKFLKGDKVNVFWGTQHILPKKVENIRYVLTVHDLALLINRRWGSRVNAFMQNTFLRPSVKDADLLISVSESTKNDLIKICKVPGDKISVIYEGGVDKPEFIKDTSTKYIKDKYKIGGDYFLYVGKIEPRKNIDSIVRAFNVIAAQRTDIYLVLAGGLGWRYKKILRLIQKSKYKDRIIMPGYIDYEDKAALYSEASAVVFVSHYEGFGIPVLEALSFGIPVITAENSSLPEVGGEAVIYIEDENNYNDIAVKMEYVLNLSETERNNYKLSGETQVSNFSWGRCAAETTLILKTK